MLLLPKLGILAESCSSPSPRLTLRGGAVLLPPSTGSPQHRPCLELRKARASRLPLPDTHPLVHTGPGGGVMPGLCRVGTDLGRAGRGVGVGFEGQVPALVFCLEATALKKII